MAKIRKTVTAGPLTVEVVYPAINARDGLGVRAGKKKMQSEAQARMNLIYDYQRLELLIAANFGVKDIFATLTYDDDHLPKTRKQAAARIKYFIGKLRTARRKRGYETKYIYNIEHKHESCDGRYHHHILLNSTGDDLEELRKLWGQGMVEFIQIRLDRERNFETLARYFCKEQRDKVGDRLWSVSRNLKKPVKDCRRVPNDTPLTPPPGVTVLFDTGDVITAYGHYRYIKYLGCLEPPRRNKKTSARRRRQREHII